MIIGWDNSVNEGISEWGNVHDVHAHDMNSLEWSRVQNDSFVWLKLLMAHELISFKHTYMVFSEQEDNMLYLHL